MPKNDDQWLTYDTESGVFLMGVPAVDMTYGEYRGLDPAAKAELDAYMSAGGTAWSRANPPRSQARRMTTTEATPTDDETADQSDQSEQAEELPMEGAEETGEAEGAEAGEEESQSAPAEGEPGQVQSDRLA